MQRDIDNYMSRLGAMESERSTWMNQWMDLSRHFAPRYGRFRDTDRNQGRKVHEAILDETPAVAARTLANGLMSGTTSPARPWFKIGLEDKDLMNYHPVKLWLSGVTRLMLAILSKSNAYGCFRHNYMELGTFGTSCAMVLPNFDNFAHFYPLTTGEYCLAQDAEGKINTLYRKFDMTIANIVKTYGIDNVSSGVRNLFNNGRGHDQWRTIVQVIEPREDRDHTRRDTINMPFKSVHFEYGAEHGTLLRESGFKRFPGYAARWDTSGGDIYGNSPAMLALGSAKQLQFNQKRKAQTVDYKLKPPLAVPASLRNTGLDLLPGAKNYVDMAKGEQIQSAWNVDLDLRALLEDIQDLRIRIDETMYKDLFLMLASIDHTGMTAREVAERHEEKLLMLGPVTENLQQEKDSQVVDLLFDMIEEAGFFLPDGPLPIPQELQGSGQSLQIEFIGVLAQAQRAVSTSATNRLVELVGGVAGLKPDIVDKVDFDELIDQSAEALGVDPRIIVPDDVVMAMRTERAEKQAAMEQAAVAAEGAKAASSVASATGATLDDMLAQFSGYTLPQGEA